MISVTSPYQVICKRPLPREIKSLMNLPPRERELSMGSSLLPLNKIKRKLLLLYTGPYLVTQVKGNNTYEIKSVNNNKLKGVYNLSLIHI